MKLIKVIKFKSLKSLNEDLHEKAFERKGSTL